MIIPDPEAAGGERAKILDFGIAKVAAQASGPQAASQTRTGSLLGTPAYMAPEQCRGAGQVDDRADVYAFGVMLYHMLAGQPPFVAQSDFDVMALHLYQSPPPLQQHVPALSRELVALVHATLRKVPTERPSIAQVASELQRLATEFGQSQPGLRTSPWGAAAGQRPARMLGLALVALGGVGAVALFWGLHERKTPPLVHPVVTPTLKVAPTPTIAPIPTAEKPPTAVLPGAQRDSHTAGTDATPDRAVTHTKPTSSAAHAAKEDNAADALKLSLNQYMQGSFAKAIHTAMPCARENPQQAWRIIGSAACHLKKLPLINEAYRRVDEGGRKYIVLVCQSQGLGLSAKQEFQATK